ncbi:MAG: hypothetical protein FWD46_00670 [Cystobacterineae bacterium]|nr:hypothetical protein [Cystobacterineae bacterium]
MKLLTQASYLLLAVSAVFVLWVQRNPGRFPASWENAAPWLFLSFAILLSAQSILKAFLGQSSLVRSLMHIGVAAAFLMVLFLGVPKISKPRVSLAASTTYEMERLLVDPDERIRILAAELVRYRPEGLELAPALVKALEDASSLVRKTAHVSLVHLNGDVDLGDPESQDGIDAWKQRFQ